jgi:hypothetical protein
MSRPRCISTEAKEAGTPKEIWQLFFSEEMLDLIVLHTNQKITEEQEEKWTAERLQRCSHMKPIDKVSYYISVCCTCPSTTLAPAAFSAIC